MGDFGGPSTEGHSQHTLEFDVAFSAKDLKREVLRHEHLGKPLLPGSGRKDQPA
jgi:hypothetical protein